MQACECVRLKKERVVRGRSKINQRAYKKSDCITSVHVGYIVRVCVSDLLCMFDHVGSGMPGVGD